MAQLAAPARTFTHRTTMLGRIREIAAHHELLLNLVRLELKAKYKASALGFAWSLLNPAMYLVVFYIAFDVILGGGIPRFPIYLLSGLLVWNFFTTALNSGTGSVVAGAGLVKKVWFPREILPLASVGAALVHFFLQLLVLSPPWSCCAIRSGGRRCRCCRWPWSTSSCWPPGSRSLFSAANVYLRDMAHFVELALLAWFWVTPIVYPFTQLDRGARRSRRVALLNPVTPIVLTFQRAFTASTGIRRSSTRTCRLLWYLRNLAIVDGRRLGPRRRRAAGLRPPRGQPRRGALRRWRRRSRSTGSPRSSGSTTRSRPR